MNGSYDNGKFLSFYKKEKSLSVDLFFSAFYMNNQTYEELAEFVYSLLSVGGTFDQCLVPL